MKVSYAQIFCRLWPGALDGQRLMRPQLCTKDSLSSLAETHKALPLKNYVKQLLNIFIANGICVA